MRSRFKIDLDYYSLEEVIIRAGRSQQKTIGTKIVKLPVDYEVPNIDEVLVSKNPIISNYVDYESYIYYKLQAHQKIFSNLNPDTDYVDFGSDWVQAMFGYNNPTLDITYNSELQVYPEIDLTSPFTFEGPVIFDVQPPFGAAESEVPMSTSYFGLGDPTTTFIGIKVTHTSGFDGIRNVDMTIKIYVCKVSGGSETTDLVYEKTLYGDTIDNTYEDLDLTGTLRFNRVDFFGSTTYVVELTIGETTKSISLGYNDSFSSFRVTNNHNNLQGRALTIFKWYDVEYG